MTDSILQSYLNEQHIKTDVKENIESLTKAVKAVKNYLIRKKIKDEIVPFTLVALDPKVSDTDPVVAQVEKIIIKNWPAFKNSVASTKDKSTTYVRAVILESLSQLSKDNENLTALVWLTARDVIRHYQLGSEENVIIGLLQELANGTEENGQKAWGISKKTWSTEFEEPEISINSVKAAKINEEVLKQHLLDANVHSSYSSQAGGGKNPQSFRDHSGWQYFKFMSEHAAKGITEVVNTSLLQQNKALDSISTTIQDELNAYFAQLQPYFEELNQSFTNSITANNRRNEILWWKQSLYSPLLNNSYRSLDQLSAAICMAIDLSKQVEAVYPESLDYLLKETLKDLHGEQIEEDRPLVEWLEDIHNLHEGIKATLTEHVSEGDTRKPLLSALANILQSGQNSDFFSETGIDKKTKLSVSDLALWVFHGLQIKKLEIAK